MSRFPPQHNVHPNVVTKQYDTHNVWHFENRWREELFHCKPMGQCCFACFCPCCMGYKLAGRLGESAFIGCCCYTCALPYLRTKLRTARRIEGNCCGDTCSTHCCGPCASNQLANELTSQGLWDISKTRKTHPKDRDRDRDRDRFNNNGDY